MNLNNSDSDQGSSLQPVNYKAPLILYGNVIGIGLVTLNFVPYLLNSILEMTKSLWTPFVMKNYEVSMQILNLVFYSLPFIVTMFIITKALNRPLKVSFPMRKPRFDVLVCSVGIALAGLVLGSMLTSSVADILAFTTKFVPTSPDISAPRGNFANSLYFINIAVLPAILEEGLFRGVLMQSLRRFGDSFALITSSVLFGILHGNLVQLPYTLFMGLIIGYFVLYSGSLWPGIAIHFANNGLSVLIEWLTRSTTATEDTSIGLIFFFGRMIFGIFCLIYLRKSLGSLFYIPPSTYPLKEKKKNTAFYSTVGMLLFLGVSIYYVLQYLEPSVAGGV